MKVCTDACLFGAFVANEIQDKTINHILDIGAGTGLLFCLVFHWPQKLQTNRHRCKLSWRTYPGEW